MDVFEPWPVYDTTNDYYSIRIVSSYIYIQLALPIASNALLRWTYIKLGAFSNNNIFVWNQAVHIDNLYIKII